MRLSGKLSEFLRLGLCLAFVAAAGGMSMTSSAWAVDDKTDTWGSSFTGRGHLAFEDPPNPENYVGIEPSSGADPEKEEAVAEIVEDRTDNDSGDDSGGFGESSVTYGAEDGESSGPVTFE